MNTSSSPSYTAFSGITVDSDCPPDELEAINDYFRGGYLSELKERHPEASSTRRYEFLDGRGTRFLTAFDLTSEDVIGRFVSQSDRVPPEVEPDSWRTHTRTTWTLIYRHVAETGPSIVDPYAIYVLGVNPPKGLDEAGMVEFNDFYTNVHMPEVAERRHCLRASRFELEQKVLPARSGSPQFLAVYEVDEQGSNHRRHVGGSYARGPEVWQRHTTPWRIWYRQLPR